MEIYPQHLRISVGGKALSGATDTLVLDELFAEIESSIPPDEQFSDVDVDVDVDDIPASAQLSDNPSELLQKITVTSPAANFMRSNESFSEVETKAQEVPDQIPSFDATSTSESELPELPQANLKTAAVVSAVVPPAQDDNTILLENSKSERALLDGDKIRSLQPSNDQPQKPNIAEITLAPKSVVDEAHTGSDLETHIGGDPKKPIRDDMPIDSFPQKLVRTQDSYSVSANTTVGISTVEKTSIDRSITIVGDSIEAMSGSKYISSPTENLSRASALSILTTQPAIQTRVPEQVIAAISSPRDETIEIRLDPPELGKVRVTLTQSENGTLAQIVSEKSEIADLLRRNAALLTKELTKAGFENVSLDFQSNSEQHSSHQQPGDDGSTYEVSLGSAATNEKPRSAYVTNSDSLDRRI